MAVSKKDQKYNQQAQSKIKEAKETLLERLENYLSKNNLRIILGIMGLSLILSILMFDVKISIGHDDALYIQSAYTWSLDLTGYFYNATAPLYIMFLIIPIKIWGLNLIVLKSFSVLFFMGALWFFYVAFKNRISYVVLFSSLFITALVGFFADKLSYSSLTYTECFYMFIASLFLVVFFNLIDKTSENNWTLKSTFKNWMALGFMLLLLSISRSVAVVSVVAVVAYFLIRLQWKEAILSVLSFGIFRTGFELIKKTVWGDRAILTDQLEIILRKEAYNPSAGYENMNGFFERFEGNILIYLSGRFWEILGFSEQKRDAASGQLMLNPLFAYLVVILLLIGLFQMIKKKEKYHLAALLFSGAIMGATFFALQTTWGQGRLVMIHIPFILLVFFFLFKNWFKNLGVLYIFILIIFAGVGLNKTVKASKTNLKYLSKNLKGDLFAGYTDDWSNYLKLSKWCGDSLPANSKIACRKAPMSFVYAPKLAYFPIYSIPSNNADTIYKVLKRNKVTHVIFANLRLDEKHNGDVVTVLPFGYPPIYMAYQEQDKKSIINTIHNHLAPLAQVKPKMFELVKVMGTDEEAISYKINTINNSLKPKKQLH